MLGGRTCSAAARAPSDRGPPNTSTDKRRELGRAQPGGDVHLPDEPEQVDGGGVQAEGDPAAGRSSWVRSTGGGVFSLDIGTDHS